MSDVTPTRQPTSSKPTTAGGGVTKICSNQTRQNSGARLTPLWQHCAPMLPKCAQLVGTRSVGDRHRCPVNPLASGAGCVSPFGEVCNFVRSLSNPA